MNSFISFAADSLDKFPFSLCPLLLSLSYFFLLTFFYQRSWYLLFSLSLWCVLQFRTLKQLKNSQRGKKPRCRVQVAWPLRHPGVDRPVSVFVSLFHVFFPFLFIYFLHSSPLGFLPMLLSWYLYLDISSYVTLPSGWYLLPQGERCSFSVQMWYYFLCGLRSDLWAVLPAELAKEVFGQVLSETLQLLVQRYARARPSYKRHLQIRYIIMVGSVMFTLEIFSLSLYDWHAPRRLCWLCPMRSVLVTIDAVCTEHVRLALYVPAAGHAKTFKFIQHEYQLLWIVEIQSIGASFL